jgi:hypothetical protein
VQLGRGLEDRDFHPVREQATRGFEPEQATADDRSFFALFGVFGDPVAIVDFAEQERAGAAEPFHWRNERP